MVLAGCGTTVQGKAVSIFEDPFKVAGLQAVDGTSGLRPDAEKPSREVTDGDGGKDDEIAAQSVSDLETFWKDAYGQTFDGQFEPVKDLIYGATGSTRLAVCEREGGRACAMPAWMRDVPARAQPAEPPTTQRVS